VLIQNGLPAETRFSYKFLPRLQHISILAY
jgi:hypothetical protein